MGRPTGDDDRSTVDLRGSLELRRASTGEIAAAAADEAEAAADEAAADDDAATDLPTAHDGAPHHHLTPDPVHALPTQSLPRKRTNNPKTGSQSHQSLTRYTTTTSPVEAMRHEEIARTRVFLQVAIVTCICGIIVALIAGGDPIARRVVIIGSFGAIGGSAWILWLTRDPTRYKQSRMLAPGFALGVGSMAGVYYWGCASPVTALLLYGIYFFSLGSDAKVTFIMYVVVAIAHAILGALIISGAIVDRGLVTIASLTTVDQLSLMAIIEFLYLITYFTARKSQRVTLDAMEKLEAAVRSVAQREALLAEARAELDRALKIGGPGRFTEQVVGSFRLGALIGRGGMGEVYEAFGVADKREAAVKLLHPGTLGDPTSVARFMREAETAAKLDNPHVVRVLEVGTTGGEIPFLAMERLRGHDLAHHLRRQRRMALPQTKTMVAEVAQGLEAARAAGIVHRDLKPHNVFHAEGANGERTWKVLDFGVSKVGGSGTLTQGHVVGTPAYMAPEQARGIEVDHRADVYSLAAIVYRMVTGHPAFTGKDVPSTLYEVVYRVPTQPSILAQVPADLDRVLAIGLAKDPADRFATALELAAWVERVIDRGLDHEQRRRADELILRQPWGMRLGGS